MTASAHQGADRLDALPPSRHRGAVRGSAPAGARIRTRPRIVAADQAVLRRVGERLGRLAGLDLAERCRPGLGEVDRVRRKRQLTAASSSRWAGALTRTSEDQWQRAHRNLLDDRTRLHRAIRRTRVRLAAPAGGRPGRARGYASRFERWQKQRRLQQLTARLAGVEAALRTAGSVSSGVAGACCTLATTSTASWPRPCGGGGGGQPAGFSPPTATRSIRSATGPSRWTPSRAGAS
jgi:hypothetical protein